MSPTYFSFSAYASPFFSSTIFYILNYETVFLKFYFVYLIDAEVVINVPTDIRNLANLFLLKIEAEVLFFDVMGLSWF